MNKSITYAQARKMADTVYSLVFNERLLEVPDHYHAPIFAMRGRPLAADMEEMAYAIMRDYEYGDRQILKIFSDLQAKGKI